jgi:hypothetical protein
MKAADELKKSDLGLSYVDAAHGVQSATQWAQAKLPSDYDHNKHNRVGIDLSKSDQMGLAALLVDKGLFTWDEYREYMRLAVNKELSDREEEANSEGYSISFR